MAQERILIVEDERIVAEDLQSMLKDLGYEPVGIASSAEEALKKTADTHPDLVLMDIRLNGEMDGIDAAEQIWVRYEIPVTYLTAYADERTLDRAKATLPFGYILKPFEERDLRTTIEIALYKHRMEHTLTNIDSWYAAALGSLSYAVITTDSKGQITFMNPAAEALTGRTIRQVYGHKFADTFRIDPPRAYGINPVERAMSAESATPYIEARGILVSSDGREIPIDYRTTPIKDRDGSISGNILIFHDHADQKHREHV